jgi:hypothetical protein
MTHLQYKAALAKVIAEGKVKLDQARQLSRSHLESPVGLQVGDHGNGGGGGGQ